MKSLTNYESLTVKELKEILRSRNLSMQGLKKDLIHRLTQSDLTYSKKSKVVDSVSSILIGVFSFFLDLCEIIWDYWLSLGGYSLVIGLPSAIILIIVEEFFGTPPVWIGLILLLPIFIFTLWAFVMIVGAVFVVFPLYIVYLLMPFVALITIFLLIPYMAIETFLWYPFIPDGSTNEGIFIGLSG